jgi:hypothetical protein
VPVDMPPMELELRKPPELVLAVAPASEPVAVDEPAWADAELLPAVALVAASCANAWADSRLRMAVVTRSFFILYPLFN